MAGQAISLACNGSSDVSNGSRELRFVFSGGIVVMATLLYPGGSSLRQRNGSISI